MAQKATEIYYYELEKFLNNNNFLSFLKKKFCSNILTKIISENLLSWIETWYNS